MTDDKRRLRLLPELLPDPTRGVAMGSVRQRTLRHMNRLLALAAASATVGACSNSRVTGDNAPELGPDRPSPTSQTPVGRGLANAPGVAEHPPGGYAVVDPIPRPATVRLQQIAQTILARATWKSPSTFRLRLSEPRGWTVAAYSGAEALVTGGTVVSRTVVPNSAKFDIRFEPNSESVTLYVPIDCVRCSRQQLRAVVQRADDGGLSVTLDDVW